MFEKIIAQEKAKKIISEQIKNNKIPHAYLFVGEDGVGKFLMAVEFAKILNCTINEYTNTDVGSCGHCDNCKQISNNSFSDLHIVNFQMQADLLEEDLEKQKTIKIDTIRQMNKDVYIKAVNGKWKFFIIEQAEKMNLAAFNCLLKTLEEPPQNTIIILIAKHKETIPVTILSRTQTIFFQPLPAKEIAGYLEKEHSLSSDKATDIANLCDGSIEKAESIMLNTQNEYSTLWTELTNKKIPVADILTKSKSVAKSRDNAIEAIDILMESAIKSFRKEPEKYKSVIKKISESKQYLNQNVNPNTVMDNLFMDINLIIK